MKKVLSYISVVLVLSSLTYYSSTGNTPHDLVNSVFDKEIDGQKLLYDYDYDNVFPFSETFYYMDSNGKIQQIPSRTSDIGIDPMTFHSTLNHTRGIDTYNPARFIYAFKGKISIDTAQDDILMEFPNDSIFYVYEVPDNSTQVSITPLVEGAEFLYFGNVYSFGAVGSDTYGVLEIASNGAVEGQRTNFTIQN